MTDTKKETRPSSGTEPTKRTWLQVNGGTIFGIGVFVLLAILSFLMWLVNAA